MFRKKMIKGITTIAAVCMIAGAPAFFTSGGEFAPVSVYAAEKKYAVSNVESLNVRTDAGTEFPVVNANGAGVSLKLNEKAEITGEKNGWYRIGMNRDGVQITGYVISDYVVVLTETVPEKKEENGKKTEKSSGKKARVTGKVRMSAVLIADKVRLRTGAGTSYQQVEADGAKVLLDIDTKVSVTGEKKDTEGNKWYRLSAKTESGSVQGYTLSRFVKLRVSKKKPVLAEVVNRLGINIHKKADPKSRAILAESGKKIRLTEGSRIRVFYETNLASGKFFKVSFKLGKKEISGYIGGEDVKLLGAIGASGKTIAENPKKDNGKKDDKKTDDKKTDDKKTDGKKKDDKKDGNKIETPDVDKEKGKTGPKKGEKPEPEPEEREKTPEEIAAEDAAFPEQKGFVNTDQTELYNEANYGAKILVENETGISYKLRKDQEVTVRKRYTVDGERWYMITYETVDSRGLTLIGAGFIPEKKIRLDGGLVGKTTGSKTRRKKITREQFERHLAEQGFPEDYKVKLRNLHEVHPEWRFEIKKVGIDWETAVKEESKIGLNLIYNSRNTAWKSLEKNAYDWGTDSFIAYDGKSFVTASEKAVRYYMDPRNFLNEDGIYQFEVLSFLPEFHTEEGVNMLLSGTAMKDEGYEIKEKDGRRRKFSYAETFLLAAVYSGVSPYHLASRVKQEVGGGGVLSASARGDVKGYEGIYNFYNIGAFNSTAPMGAVLNGLNFAKNGRKDRPYNEKMSFNTYLKIPWDSPYKAILGGAGYIGDNYIGRGQNTTYLQKFNVTEKDTFAHQYMANIDGARMESLHTKKAYAALPDAPLVFSIPVFRNMPKEASPMPTDEKHPNNWLSSLKVDGYSLTPSFSPEKTEGYSALLKKGVNKVGITAVPVNRFASVSGTGEVRVKDRGVTDIRISVTAENGSVRVYTVRLVKEG